MNHYIIDPITDPRWRRLVDRHPDASIFHTTGWLESLQQTYGYQTIAFTTSPPGQELDAAIPLCRVQSWITGRRLVSLPFSDHCDVLTSRAEDASTLLDALSLHPERGNGRYVEIRPRAADSCAQMESLGFARSARFWSHQIDLNPGADALFKCFHKDCVQRKIRRAERAQIRVEQGQVETLLKDFYRMHMRTRRRQGLVPQPFAWFRTLAACLGTAMQVRVAYLAHRPVAGIVTLTHRDRMVYKYGASDDRHSALGGNQLLFWRAIQEACGQGLREFDLGRTDLDNPGLAQFKERLGAARRELVYYRNSTISATGKGIPYAHFLSRAVALAPLNLLRAAGTLFYRHAG